MITPRQAAFDLNKLPEIPIAEWQNHVVNDFEEPVFDQYPVLADIKQQLYNQGALYASMSGTGSTIYGIFSKHQKVDLNIAAGKNVFIHNSAGGL
jgi:4-diphosphocytidyl-2-C-methyl-D-erythritol kinase